MPCRRLVSETTPKNYEKSGDVNTGVQSAGHTGDLGTIPRRITREPEPRAANHSVGVARRPESTRLSMPARPDPPRDRRPAGIGVPLNLERFRVNAVSKPLDIGRADDPVAAASSAMRHDGWHRP